MLGSYAIAILSPHTYPNRNGMAFLFGAVALTICNDVGALFTGRWFGTRPLNAALSPNKTIQGTVGGTVITLLAGLFLLPVMSPWTMTHGLEAAVALSIVVPLGDLFESMVKRSLGRQGSRSPVARTRRTARSHRRAALRPADHVLPPARHSN